MRTKDLNEYIRAKTACVGVDGPEGPALIDVHFIKVLVDETVDHDHLVQLVEECLGEGGGEFTDIDRGRLKAGPSYIELGAWLGDQTQALRFMAMGEAVKLWEVVTPEKLHITGSQANELAGNGFVMISGYTP